MKQSNLNNKSLELLEKEKLQAEIDILHARLGKEFPDEKPRSTMDKLAEFAGKWSSFVLGAVALFSAVFGVFVPLTEYLDEQRKALEYSLNEDMISFVDGLNSEDPSVARRSIMMLSYYETNSVPILLFFLEDSQNDQTEFREKIIETINLIYADHNGAGIIELILDRLQNNFNNIKDKSDGSTDTKRRMAWYNFMELIDGMELRDSDMEEVMVVLTNMKALICTDKIYKDKDDKDYIDLEMEFMRTEICLYLGIEDKCN